MKTMGKRALRALGVTAAAAGLLAINASTASAHNGCWGWDCEWHWSGNTVQVQNSHNSDIQSWVWVNDESIDGKAVVALLEFKDRDKYPYGYGTWDSNGANNDGNADTFVSDVRRWKLCEGVSERVQYCENDWHYAP
ncbi:hypothetical protein [Streptomyces sp. NBC_01353]|uniref:hypothetical protein n=1 Tax=Streptomyces sp. NBC_01353 TaxID=2903835 RepID=UPI002E33BBC3|nr:hypothetical protein [Streptomyces sp. NBC_01353]